MVRGLVDVAAGGCGGAVFSILGIFFRLLHSGLEYYSNLNNRIQEVPLIAFKKYFGVVWSGFLPVPRTSPSL